MVANDHNLIPQNGAPDINRNGLAMEIHQHNNGAANGHARRVEVPRALPPTSDILILSPWQKIVFPWILVVVHTIFRYIMSLLIVLQRCRKKASAMKGILLSALMPGWSSEFDVTTAQGFKNLRQIKGNEILAQT